MHKSSKLAVMSMMLTASTFAFAASKKSIVCETFPEYDWVLNVLGDKASNYNVTLLQDSGTDLHSYQPSFQDVAKISDSDMFIYVGGESDEWVEKALESKRNGNMIVVNMMEMLGDNVYEEELVEGMQSDEHEHEHGHEHDEEITEKDIKPRKLSEFNGEWQSLYPLFRTGALDEYVRQQSEKKSISIKDARAEISEKWNCGVKYVTVSGDKITFIYDNGKKATETYTYAGYATKKDESGKISNVRYKFLAKGKNGPKYVMFNDHGHEPASSVAHFHIYFGDKSFDDLMNSKSNPFFVDKKLNAEGCLENLMGHEHGHDHNHEAEEHHHHHHEDEDEDEVEYDEHVWLSLKNAIIIVNEIRDSIIRLDPSNAAAYRKNAEKYTAQLAKLDGEYKAAVSSGSFDTLLFADRFPFRYLVEDYGLKYYAAFIGCSAESEASFETISFLVSKVNELNLNAVLTIEKSDKKIAKTVVSNSKRKNCKILEMNSLQSVSRKDIKAGLTYLDAMKSNLTVLKQALQK